MGREQAALLAEDRKTAEFFEEAVSELLADVKEGGDRGRLIQSLYNYFMTDLRGLMNEKGAVSLEETKITPENLADLAAIVARRGKFPAAPPRTFCGKCSAPALIRGRSSKTGISGRFPTPPDWKRRLWKRSKKTKRPPPISKGEAERPAVSDRQGDGETQRSRKSGGFKADF